MNRTLLAALLGIWVMGTGCPAPVADDDDAASDDDDTADRPVIPDPGTADADWGWNLNDVCCSTPETAHPVGVVDASPGYIQGVIDENLNFFYVFRAGSALTEFTFPSFFEDVHLHDGAGLHFGDELTPSAEGDFDTTWTVDPDGVYVVEIISDFSGFF